MNILITGGAGFIGASLSLKLLEDGHQVTVLDALVPQIHGNHPEKSSPLYRSIVGKVRFIQGSVCDSSAWREALLGQDCVVHLAAETGTGQSMYEIKRYSDVNVGGTALLLEMLSNGEHEIQKVLVASSRAVYGEGKYRSNTLGIVYPGARKESDLRDGRFEPLCPASGEPMEALPTDEESKLHPTSVYGITKQNQEQMVMTVAGSLGLAATSLRYQNVYGPGQSLSNPYTGILSIFSTRMLNGNPVNIFEDGKESRDFVYIDDVVEATRLALFNDAANNEIMGIGSGTPTSVETVARFLARSYESNVEIKVSGAYRLGDIRHNYADMQKAERLIGFRPKVDFKTGIGRFTEWVRGQAVQMDNYDRSLDEMKKKGLFKP